MTGQSQQQRHQEPVPGVPGGPEHRIGLFRRQHLRLCDAHPELDRALLHSAELAILAGIGTWWRARRKNFG